MSEKKLSLLMRLAIILIAVCGVAICAFWVPVGIFGWLNRGVAWADLQTIEFWLQFIFQWMVSLPCFYLLFLAWHITADMKEGKLFAFENSLRTKRAAYVLTVDLLVFLIGHTVFALLQWNTVYGLYAFVAVIGLILAVFLVVLSHYLCRAAELQEESDLTI